MIFDIFKNLPTMIDGAGSYGIVLTYAITVAAVGSALLMFIHLWYQGRLDMDEEPKLQMMNLDQEEQHEPQ